MAYEKPPGMAGLRCDNCCFSTFAGGYLPAEKGSEGSWNILEKNLPLLKEAGQRMLE